MFSFICMIISLSDLFSMCKIQKNPYFQTRPERLIMIHIKDDSQEDIKVIGHHIERDLWKSFLKQVNVYNLCQSRFCHQTNLSTKRQSLFDQRNKNFLDSDCTKEKISRVPAGIWIPLLGEKKKESLLLPANSAGPTNHPTTDRRRSLARNQWSTRLSVYRTDASTNSGGFLPWKNSGVPFCLQALCCSWDTAAAAVLTEVKTFMFGAIISPIVRLHCVPLENHNAAGLFRFCVASMLALPEFRSLLSGCINNI